MWLNRLGIITDEVSPRLSEALDWIRRHELKHVEIRMVDGKNVIGLSDAEADLVRAQVEAHGLHVSVLASPVFKCPLDPNRQVAQGDTFGHSAGDDVEAHFVLLARAFELADRLGAQMIRIFSFWREHEPERYEQEIIGYLRRAAKLAEAQGKLLLLENEPSCNGGCAREVGHYVRLTESAALKVLWDPGNEAYTGRRAFPEGYDEVKDVLGHVHLKDAVFRAEGDAACVPVGSGDVAFIDHFHALREQGYEGYLTIETHYIPENGTQADGSYLSLQGVRRVFNG